MRFIIYTTLTLQIVNELWNGFRFQVNFALIGTKGWNLVKKANY